MRSTKHETRILFEHVCDSEPPDLDSFTLAEATEWAGLEADRMDDVRDALQLAVDDGTMSFDGVRYRWMD